MTLPESMLTSGARMSKWNLEGSTVVEIALGLFCQSPIRMKGCVVVCSRASSLEMMVALSLTLDALIGAEVDACNEDCQFGGLPQEGLVSTALEGEGFHRCEAAGLVTEYQDASMGARGITVGPSWCAKRCAASDGVVLAQLLMLLWVKVCLHEDVWFAGACPVPVSDLSAKIGDVGIVYSVMRLLEPGPLLRTGVKWWVKVWLFRRWQSLDDLLCGAECVDVYRPYLDHLTG